MAQLYKMTLYVCDLEENLSLSEIETLVKQDALDSSSVSCLCHFADGQVGKQVEWHDDIDLNSRGCPTSAWEKYFTHNADVTKTASGVWLDAGKNSYGQNLTQCSVCKANSIEGGRFCRCCGTLMKQ